ncbi:MAG: hypothetical protein Q8K67_04680 [Geothrix sp.]|nr:hypothetical protein [Geothrix sp.]
MTTPDLEALSAMTREYAAFQARKSGLATALGGLMAVLFLTAPMYVDALGIRLMGRYLLEYLLLAPFVWLALKTILARVLYRDLGKVKGIPDAAYERRRWFWILGIALFIGAFLVLCILGFASGFLHAIPAGACMTMPSLGALWLPLLYIVPTPWLLRGIEEARAYAVLVGECMLWFLASFLAFWSVRPYGSPSMEIASTVVQIVLVLLLLAILIWSALAMVRGWKEHREYLALLRTLPRES